MAGNDVRDKANEAAKKAKALSPSVQYAIIQVLPNILNGAFWGFTDMKGIQEHLDAIKESGGSIVARKLGDSCLVEVDPNFLLSAVIQIDNNAIKQKDLEVMKTKRAEAEIMFEKFLISKGKKLDENGKLFANTIGIYCVNDVNNISYKSKMYPAFRVSMQTVLALLHRYGYMIKVGDKMIPAEQAATAGQALWSSVRLSPTKTGLFIDIASTYSPEKIKELEKQFKQFHQVK